MQISADMHIVAQLIRGGHRGASHAERLENFYRAQANGYDAFRARLLPAREGLVRRALAMCADGYRWVDLGAGTGAAIDFAAEHVQRAGHILLVDLTPSLLRVAKERVHTLGLQNVECREADARHTGIAPASIDCVTLSYALTMMPNWWQVLEHAHTILRPGGRIAIVDFYLPAKHPSSGRARLAGLLRNVYRAWFEFDNVFLSTEHLPYVADRFQMIELEESRTALPYVPLARVPYYTFIGVRESVSESGGRTLSRVESACPR